MTLIAYQASTANLNAHYREVEHHQAEVANVVARKDAIVAQYADQPDSLEKRAELVGSENRIRVATQRFNEAAAVYNQSARSFPASLFTGSRFPRQVELAPLTPSEP
ncbi:hypothetical protein DL240_02620 [Lujinxingia litoralis]|uniref:LemA family protein n=2 Tax=Lujinxingia litoralis TaxID=2211119 RepID=A0A328CBH2_9DELT|nr:hypothetical protein DL240_02620 [Lujinxingia litoralis]